MTARATTPTHYLDLCDPSGRWPSRSAPVGWSAVDPPGINFRRPEGLWAFLTLSRNGSIESLRAYVDLAESDFGLLVGLIAADGINGGSGLLDHCQRRHPHLPTAELSLHSSMSSWGKAADFLLRVIR